MLSNDKISDIFKLTAQLLELHEANPFKVKGYTSAVYQIDKLAESVFEKTVHELSRMGFTSNMAEKIVEVCEKNTLHELEDLLNKTPQGLLAMLKISGLGVKKVQVLWKELNLTTVEDLFSACKNNQVAALKGFGEKTQANILQQISYKEENKQKLRIDKAHYIAKIIATEIQKSEYCQAFESVGEIRRCLEVVTVLQFVVATENFDQMRNVISQIAEIIETPEKSGVFVWRGKILPTETPIEFHLTATTHFANKVFLLSTSLQHLNEVLPNGKTLLQTARNKPFATEQEIYSTANLPYIVPEMREGYGEIALATQNKLPNLITFQDLRGTLHNHSTYSDGKNSLEEMAVAAKNMGLMYFGIADHSQTATYAHGLTVDRIKAQHAEIDKLNEKLAPFKILKGIESDILGNGDLDYAPEILASFDYVVASVHSNLKMDKETATQRLLKAIENPYTTILGHLTGRRLLRREGYPLDFKAIIAACVANNVVIEINASPDRLDLDWRWVQYALDCGVMLSINPDAHDTESLAYMHYGVLMGRKGGLTKEQNLNSMTLSEIEQFFKNKVR
jgi:DNA polymerase (family 10)